MTNLPFFKNGFKEDKYIVISHTVALFCKVKIVTSVIVAII